MTRCSVRHLCSLQRCYTAADCGSERVLAVTLELPHEFESKIYATKRMMENYKEHTHKRFCEHILSHCMNNIYIFTNAFSKLNPFKI